MSAVLREAGAEPGGLPEVEGGGAVHPPGLELAGGDGRVSVREPCTPGLRRCATVGSGSLVGTLPRLVGSLLICGPLQERVVRRDLIGACEVFKRCVH